MTTFGIKFNTQQGPTADTNLRKAIAYAFDYDGAGADPQRRRRAEDEPVPATPSAAT